MAIPIDLSGRKALVTGVTSGIGLGIARKLAEAGCEVAGCGLRERPVAALAAVNVWAVFLRAAAEVPSGINGRVVDDLPGQ